MPLVELVEVERGRVPAVVGVAVEVQDLEGRKEERMGEEERGREKEGARGRDGVEPGRVSPSGTTC